ncbi:MAG: TonB family protein [Balneolaceae bacterium]|nr:MAG: TonB family protein [Balneolaceae bacterium]
MLDWFKKNIYDDEERFGITITGVLHLILIIIALLYTVHFNTMDRSAFMEITLGEFRSGTIAQRADVQREQVATRPNPSPTQPVNPDPTITRPVETPQRPVEETTKPVNLPDEVEQIIDNEVVVTPETDIINPNVVERTEDVIEEVTPPRTQQAERVQEGVAESGDVRGARGTPNVDQGPGHDPVRAAPYTLQWEGELNRNPMVQPLPSNRTNEEAVITIRFEVHPDGSLGRVIPLRKMNPELEREVMRTLRSWRFSRLPSGVPQEPQWGTITFRFVLD